MRERQAEILAFTNPGRLASMRKLTEYAAIAASWERARLTMQGQPLAVDAERFVALTVVLRQLVADLGLPLVCEEATPRYHRPQGLPVG